MLLAALAASVAAVLMKSSATPPATEEPMVRLTDKGKGTDARHLSNP